MRWLKIHPRCGRERVWENAQGFVEFREGHFIDTRIGKRYGPQLILACYRGTDKPQTHGILRERFELAPRVDRVRVAVTSASSPPQPDRGLEDIKG